jgi:protein-tyrosine phosphatase
MEYYNGVTKIKDGLFIGNTETGEDIEFLSNNKLSHIINCAATEQSNLWESSGIKYLSFPWYDSLIQIIFDEDDLVLKKVSEFIDQALDKGESCLVWSVHGTSRCACLVAGYLMYKYSWSLYKTLDYINSRRKCINLNPNFVHQLVLLQNRLTRKYGKVLSCSWEEFAVNLEDLVLRNTYLNSQVAKNSDFEVNKSDKKNLSLTWADEDAIEKVAAKLQKSNVKAKSCLKQRIDHNTFSEAKLPLSDSNFINVNQFSSGKKKQNKNITKKKCFSSPQNQENLGSEYLNSEEMKVYKDKKNIPGRLASPMTQAIKYKELFYFSNKIPRPWK